MRRTSQANREAREARTQMLRARPADAVRPLPDDIDELDPNCAQYFEQAIVLYAKAAEAFQLGDTTTGLVYELWAYQHMQIGHACEARRQ